MNHAPPTASQPKDTQMITMTTHPDHGTVRAALDVACRAPSVHNTQPWRWVIAEHSLHLFADRTRQLPVIDHDGRELTISCGAALHHARIAFRALGWRPEIHRLPNPADRDHMAAIEFTATPRTDQRMLALVSAAAVRRTDRRPFLPDPVPDHLLDRITAAAGPERVTVTLVTDPTRRREIIVAMAHADRVQRDSPMYQAELAEWTRRRIGSVQGIPAYSVPAPTRFQRGMPGRDFGPGDDGAVLCLLSTDTDDAVNWLRTGEALSAASLAATTAGLSTCTLSQVAELRIARDLIRRVALDGTGEPQVMLRIGWPATAEFPGPVTPRRPLDEVAGLWPDA
jgi:nitroreductase